MYSIDVEQFLPVSLDKAWQFFADPDNLAVITPPDLDFVVLSKSQGVDIYTGMLIDYKLRPLFGIPVRWQTEIRNVQAPHVFTDVQKKGPYRVWEHTHTFKEQQGGVLMRDQVQYELPFGILGKLVHRLIVKKRVKAIFDFRRTTLDKLFVNHDNN